VMQAATFGTVVAVVGGLTDIVLDEGRNQLYLVNSSYHRIEVYAIGQRRFLTSVAVDRLPISAALSRNNKFLYVTCFDSSSLDVIDLDTMTVVNRVSLPAKPEGVAVGADDRVLITTIGAGPNNQAYTLLLYDPAAAEGRAIGNVVITPPPAQSPRLPPPSGRLALAARSRLASTPDGRYIVGLTNINNNTGVAFVYESTSASVLRSRQIGNISTVISVAPDGSKFMAGLTLFDTETLTVLAQQNAANAPFPFQTGAQFSLTDNVGGSVFSPDGARLYSAFNIPPLSNPPARPNVSQLLVNDPDNLLIHLALQLPENIGGKMVISSDGGVIYAISESGFMILPVGRLAENPIAMPESRLVLLANDQCGVVAAQRTATVKIQNLGRGRLTITPQLLQTPQTAQQGIPGLGGAGAGGGAPGGTIVIILPPTPGTQPSPVPGTTPGAQVPTGPGQQQPAVVQTAPLVRVRQADQAIDFTFNANAARSLGTITPHNFVIQAPEAVNIPPRIRVFQNNRDAEARGDIVPIEVGISDQEGLVDLALDTQRQRL
ncbi:MAG: YncE family protein, partial [Bryobacteraceae bacterium]